MYIYIFTYTCMYFKWTLCVSICSAAIQSRMGVGDEWICSNICTYIVCLYKFIYTSWYTLYICISEVHMYNTKGDGCEWIWNNMCHHSYSRFYYNFLAHICTHAYTLLHSHYLVIYIYICNMYMHIHTNAHKPTALDPFPSYFRHMFVCLWFCMTCDFFRVSVLGCDFICVCMFMCT